MRFASFHIIVFSSIYVMHAVNPFCVAMTLYSQHFAIYIDGTHIASHGMTVA